MSLSSLLDVVLNISQIHLFIQEMILARELLRDLSDTGDMEQTKI